MHPQPAPARDHAALSCPRSGPRSNRPRPILLTVVYGVGAALLAVGVTGPPAGALLGLAFVTVPGAFLVRFGRPRDRAEQIIVVLAISLMTWMLIAHVLLTFQWWHPRPVAAAALGAGCIISLLSDRKRVRTPHRSLRDRLGAVLTPIMRLQVGWTVLSLLLWAASLPFINLQELTSWGLVSVVPIQFFAALAIAVVVASTAATRPATSSGQVAAAVVPLLAIIYATLPAVSPTIRYPWAYKHLGVIRLLDETGRFHPNVDIYNNFSGFFALGALMRGATGVDPSSYAAWSQLVGEGVILVATWALVRRATDSERVAHLAVVLYLITNWVGQNYFAAQTLATFLSIAVLALVFSWFSTGETRRMRGLGERLVRLAPSDNIAPDYVLMRARRAIVLAIFLALMMSHPLTPFATLGAIGLMWIIGWVRDRSLLVGFVLVAIVGGLRALPYFAAQAFDLGFGGSPAANASGNTDYSDAPEVVLLVGQLTRLYSVGVWMTAFVGAFACLWAMRRTGMLAVAVCVPFIIPLVQSYGGEVIYRVYLYSLPLIVAFIAWGIVTRIPIERRTFLPQPTVLAATVCLGLTAGFLIAHYGREELNYVEPSEVAIDAYIAANVPDPAIIAQFSGVYPAASSARYPSFQVNDTFTPYVDELVDPAAIDQPEELDDLADYLYGLDAGTPYIVISPGMIQAIHQLNAFPVDSTAEAAAMLLAEPRYSVITRIDDSWLIKVAP